MIARPANTKPEVPFPVRGTPGGWRDIWDDPDDSAELRARAEEAERRVEERATVLSKRWQKEVEHEQIGASGFRAG